MANAFQTVLLGVVTGYVLYLITKPADATSPATQPMSPGNVVIGVPGQAPVTLRSSYVDGLGDMYSNAGIIKGANPAPPVVPFMSHHTTQKFPDAPHTTRPVMTAQPLADKGIPLSEVSKYNLTKPASEYTSAELAYMRANAGKQTPYGMFNPNPGPTLRTPSAMPYGGDAPVYVNGAYQGTVSQVAQSMVQNMTGKQVMSPFDLSRASIRSRDPGFTAAANVALQRIRG